VDGNRWASEAGAPSSHSSIGCGTAQCCLSHICWSRGRSARCVPPKPLGPVGRGGWVDPRAVREAHWRTATTSRRASTTPSTLPRTRLQTVPPPYATPQRGDGWARGARFPSGGRGPRLPFRDVLRLSPPAVKEGRYPAPTNCPFCATWAGIGGSGDGIGSELLSLRSSSLAAAVTWE
jgi:hypothetical protein